MTDRSESIMDIEEVQKFFAGTNVTSAVPDNGQKASTPATKEPQIRKKKLTTRPTKEEEEEEREDVPLPVAKTRAELYVEGLAQHNISVEEAAEIVDAMVSEFSYSETVTLTKRVDVVLRTRTPKVNKWFNEVVTKVPPQNDGVFFSLLASVNLAASMVQYGDRVFENESKEGFNNALDFVNRLPQPVFSVLTERLSKFDAKMAAVLKEGYAENF